MCVSKQPCDHPPDDFVDEETAIEYMTRKQLTRRGTSSVPR
jgi:hypothetical protein